MYWFFCFCLVSPTEKLREPRPPLFFLRQSTWKKTKRWSGLLGHRRHLFVNNIGKHLSAFSFLCVMIHMSSCTCSSFHPRPPTFDFFSYSLEFLALYFWANYETKKFSLTLMITPDRLTVTIPWLCVRREQRFRRQRGKWEKLFLFKKFFLFVFFYLFFNSLIYFSSVKWT